MPGLMFDDRLTQTYRLESIDCQSYIKKKVKDLLTISILRKFTPHNTCLHQLQSFSLAIRIKNI